VDPARVGRVVENLLENALRHAGEGGVVRVKVAAEADEMTLSVEDTGVGFQADAPLAPGHHGLGLAFCRNVVHEHAGTLTLDRSDDLRGARVKVSLPRHMPRISERPRLSLVPQS
jgi:signal transduction histidine kinase